MIILLTGPHGAGKGTIGVQLQKQGAGIHVSSGDLMRREISKGSEFGKSIEKTIAEGNYVSDEMTLKIVAHAIERLKGKTIILDGYPRNLKQAQDIESYLDKQGKHIDLVINLNADKDEIIERMSNRLICLKCHYIYNTKSAVPKTEGKCDKCDLPLVHRQEDSPTEIKQRLALYEKLTQPMTDYYRKKNLVVEIENTEVETTVKKAKEAIKAIYSKSH